MSEAYDMNYSKDSIQRYSNVDLFSTEGRMGRTRYFVLTSLLLALAVWVISILATSSSGLSLLNEVIVNGLIAITIFATMISMVYFTIQRCHDFNKVSGLALFAIVPLANFVFSMIPGTNGLNSYGEVPLPGKWFVKTAFFALIAVMIGLAIYAAYLFMQL